MSKKLLISFALVGMIFVFGCSGKKPLRGKITFSDDGSPLPVGAIYFETPTYSASGVIEKDGTYIVGSDSLRDGLPKGTYSVVIRGADEITVIHPPGGGMPRENRRPLIDSKYQNPDTSGLSFTVDGKTRKFDFQVDRAK